jgi:hypothetical protein
MNEQTRDRFSQMNRMIDSGWVLAYAQGYYAGRSGTGDREFTDDRAFWYAQGYKQGGTDYAYIDAPNSVSEETSDGI